MESVCLCSSQSLCTREVVLRLAVLEVCILVYALLFFRACCAEACSVRFGLEIPPPYADQPAFLVGTEVGIPSAQ